MSDCPDPILILGIAGRDGRPIVAPLFSVLVVSMRLLQRLIELSNACRAHRISYLTTDVIETAPYWDVPEKGFSEVSARWNVIGDIYFGELWARRLRFDGNYGKLNVIGSTPPISLSELEHMRAQEVAVDFRYHDDPADPQGDKFSTAAFRRMVAAGIWPPHISPSVIGASHRDVCPQWRR